MNEKDKGQSRKLIIIIGIALGVLFLLLGSGIFEQVPKDTETTGQYDEAAYEYELTEKIRNICSCVRGAGNVSVAVKLDGSFKAVYAQNSEIGFSGGSNTHKSEYVFVGGGSSECAVLIGYSPPEILGVGIVCDGGGNASVRAEIIALVSATFDLPTNKIYVTSS